MSDNSNHDLFRLKHIDECADKILKIVEIIKTLENLEVKWIEQDAMIRSFEIIGEASNHISKELKQKYPDVNWKEIKIHEEMLSKSIDQLGLGEKDLCANKKFN